MLSNLVEERDKAYEEYLEAERKIAPMYDKYIACKRAVVKEFISKELYIPISKLAEYTKGGWDIKSCKLVFKNGTTENIYHNYGFSVSRNGKYIESYVDDDGWSFTRNIQEEGIIGFYDLELENDREIEETYMENIISKLAAGSK